MAAGYDRIWPQVDSRLPVPLYHQLAQRLCAEIESGKYEPGSFFTTERELQERFGLSRDTVRRALQELMDRGLLRRVPGKGTFVTRPKLEVTLPHLLSFSEEIRRQGMQPSTRVEGVAWTKATAVVADALELPVGTDVLELRRLRFADGQPIVYMIDYLHPRLGLTDRDDFRNCLFEKLEKQCGVQLDEAVHAIQAMLAPPDIAPLIGIEPGAPALRFTRTTYDEQRRPVLHEEAVCRGDRYTYQVRLKREGGLRQGAQ